MAHNDLSAQEILNALHSNVAVLDGDGNITHVNEAWVRFSEERGGLPSSTGVGVNYFAVCCARGATPEVEKILAGIRAVIDEAIPQFRAEYMCNTPEETYWFELMTRPLPKPHRGAVVYHTDITELKKARDEYALILNGARGILWRAKLPGFQTTFTSKHVESILGYSVQAWTTQPDLWINRIHPEDREWVLALTARATEEGRSHDFEYRMISADGQTVWLRNIVNVVVENGRPREVVGISVDITERKLAELESQELRNEIAHVDRVSMMGQLASALAHEINQPLGAILRNAEAAELFLQNASPDLEEIRAILADIRKDDQRAGSVIDRMHALLRRQNLDKRPVDVGELVGGVVALVRSDAVARHVKLESAVADHLPPVFGDLVHLQQVLLNLIVNGMDALDEATTGQRRVRVTVSLDGPRAVEIAVSDSGSGVPADKLTHIFDPFFTTKAKGMGMGLAISRTIIEAHNGRLWVENKSEGGASFRFTLPTSEGGATK